MKKILAFILMLSLFPGILCSCGTDIAEIEGLYTIQNNIYYTTLADKAYNPEDSYDIKEKDGKTVLFINHTSISGEVIGTEAGALKSFSLKKSNFDEIIFGEAWQGGESAESIRKANKDAWKTENKNGDAFYVLLQGDGSVMIVCIKAKDGVKSCAYIRKISKQSYKIYKKLL